MDSSFWNKLKKTILTAPKAQSSSAMQLTRFNKCWLTVQNGFSTAERRSLNVQQTEIPARLKNMVDLLVDEESSLDDASGTTGVCMEYLLKHNVLVKLVNNAEGDEPRGIMGETIRTIAAMINLLDDRFLVHNAVHKPTVKLLRTCASGTEPQGESYHEDLVDLMYILCSKIHGYPELLNIFFHDKQWLTVPQRVAARRIQKNMETMEMLKNLRTTAGEVAAAADSDTTTSEGSSQDPSTKELLSSSTQPLPEHQSIPQHLQAPKSDYEFLLFSYLSRFVHREGKAGDFARTGLLFIIELATGSLAEYIMESDFTSFLSAGVGASYSQLPRKLLVRGGPNMINSMVGTLNDREPPAEWTPSRRANIELSTSTDFQSRLDAFLKLLEFCQDIMMRCPNSDIVAALLVTFKTVFLENILYPSILECSDTDGSSVAVISYIDLILQVLEHEALVDLVVGFLMASDEDDSRKKTTETTDDAFAEVQNPQTTSPYFMATGRFTLKDLILSRLKSRSQPTVIATLKLLNTVITRHCKYSLKLLSIQQDIKATSFRAAPGQSDGPGGELPLINHHVHELDLFYALISTINPHNTAEIFCNGYDSYLRDAEGAVETHQCFLRSKELDNSKAVPGQLSTLERKKQRRRSMKYGQKMDIPEDMSGDAFIEEQEKNTDALAKLSCCDKPSSHHSVAPTHRLLPTDPLLQILLGTLSHFFAHSVELNLALTGVITSLAVCPYRSLEGWLLFRSADVKESGEVTSSLEEGGTKHTSGQADVRFQLGDSDDEETLPAYLSHSNNTKPKSNKSASTAINADDASSTPAFKSFPPFFTMLRTLTQQVDYYRSEIDGFDEYLADRRRGLLVATELNSAIHTPGLSGKQLHRHQQYHQPQYHPQPQHQQQHYYAHQQQQQPHYQQYQHQPHANHGSQEFPSYDAAMGGNSPSGVTDNMYQHSSPAMPQRINTANLPSAESATLSSIKVQSPRARKSSSPSSLMSSPSNMSFLSPPATSRRPVNKPSTPFNNNIGSAPGSPLAGEVEPDVQPPSSTASPVSIYQSRMTGPSSAAMSASASSFTSSIHSTSSGSSRPAGMGGMAGMSASVTGVATNLSSWGPFGTHPNPIPNPMHLRTMDTMMIKPLFPDGFVNDSDSDAEDTGEANLELSDDDDSIGASEDGKTARGQRRQGRRTREASTSSTMSPEAQTQQEHQQQQSAHREKTVTLGQLLTNVVILEEVVKEVVAVTQVRRGLGVDKVRFL
ncbi:hypothetical protein BGX28_008567 [Mortierella sp. GBA30]|nr:hypothetical protein BGX28_008567 [Mortierella sp. GBA30]